VTFYEGTFFEFYEVKLFYLGNIFVRNFYQENVLEGTFFLEILFHFYEETFFQETFFLLEVTFSF
jgi:hypothetical protein